MKHLIFLDYDGVVNTLCFNDVNGEPNFNWPSDTRVNNTQAIAWLNKICRDFDCGIVVTSTWRKRDNYKECLWNAGLNKNINILGKTPEASYVAHETRGREIVQWMNDNEDIMNNIEDFLILDDDADMWILYDHLIQTDTYLGLGFYEWEKIRERWEDSDDAQIDLSHEERD